MENVLITGGAGFIGSHLAERLYKEGLEVYVLDNFSTGKIENISFLDKKKIFMEDIENKKEVDDIIKKYNFTYIIHLAAIVSVVDTVNNPINSHNINVNSTLHLLESVRLYGKSIKKMIFASSAAVYGRNEILPKYTDSSIDLVSPYAIQKFNSENYMSIYNDLYGIPTVSLRFFNVYGPRQNVNSTYSGVLSIMNKQFLNKKDFTFYGDGEQTRDFIYIKDLIEAINVVLKADSKYILLELPSNQVPFYTKYIIQEIIYFGKIPIIAHPERNLSIIKNNDKLQELINYGALSQVTSPSLTGQFGKKVQKTALLLIKKNLIHIYGSDMHNIRRPSLYKDGLLYLKKHKEKMNIIMNNNKHIIHNNEVFID